MAKARAIEGLASGDRFAEAARRIVEVRANEVVQHSEGVLDVGRIENLHDMRVATRRLRAALENFAPCFDRQEVGSVLRQVKDLADALGERRDRDVALVRLERFARELPVSDRPGIDELERGLRAEQEAANESLVDAVSPQRLAALADEIEAMIRR